MESLFFAISGKKRARQVFFRQDSTVVEQREGGYEVRAKCPSKLKKVEQASDKYFKRTEGGDNVRVPTPELDRAPVELSNLIAVETGTGWLLPYWNQFDGTLQESYTRAQFEKEIRKASIGWHR